MPKFKRELVPGAYLTAADMLHTLSQQQLVAAALESSIVLAAEPAVAWLLDRCCVGRPVPDAAAMGNSSDASHSSGGSDSSNVGRLAAAAAAAGVNRASQEVQQQFEQHQAQLLARKQRKARRTPGYVATAGITAPAATPVQPAAATEAVQELGVQQDNDDGAAAAAASDIALGCKAGPVEGADGAVNGLSTDPGSGSGVGQHVRVDELGQLQLVQLSCQEAFFLAHILDCCSVFALQQDLKQYHHHQQQQQEQQPAGQQDHPQAQKQHHPQQQGQRPLSPPELWRWCCSNAPGGALPYVSRYAAYKHFRCKGWLPLPGLLYGADYVLYKLHPEWAHSDFLVLVMVERPAGALASDAGAGQHQQPQLVDSGRSSGALQLQAQQQFGQQSMLLGSAGSSELCTGVGSSTGGEGSGSTQLTWLDAHIMQRLARQVLKQLLLLYVVVPPGLQLGSVECMQQVTVREVLLQRWVPSEHRAEGKA